MPDQLEVDSNSAKLHWLCSQTKNKTSSCENKLKKTKRPECKENKLRFNQLCKKQKTKKQAGSVLIQLFLADL